METIEKNIITLVYDAKSLNDLTKEFCKNAKSIIDQRGYQISDESSDSLDRMIKHNWTPLFDVMSKNRKKKVNKYITRFNNKKSLYSINLLFHFLYKNVLILGEVNEYYEVINKWYSRIIKKPKDFKCVKVDLSKKHFTIQEKRKKWKEAQTISEKLLLEYNLEKSDFYKS